MNRWVFFLKPRNAGPSDRQVPFLVPKIGTQSETLDSDIKERCKGVGVGHLNFWSIFSVIYGLKRSVELRWLFDQRCYIHPKMILLSNTCPYIGLPCLKLCQTKSIEFLKLKSCQGFEAGVCFRFWSWYYQQSCFVTCELSLDIQICRNSQQLKVIVWMRNWSYLVYI